MIQNRNRNAAWFSRLYFTRSRSRSRSISFLKNENECKMKMNAKMNEIVRRVEGFNSAISEIPTTAEKIALHNLKPTSTGISENTEIRRGKLQKSEIEKNTTRGYPKI